MNASIWTPATISGLVTGIVAIIGAIAGLITALHGHGVATQASLQAAKAEAHATATSNGVDRLTNILAPSVSINPAQTATYSSGGVSPTVQLTGNGELSGPQLAILIAWLREQHKAQVGAYPEGSNATTDWSQVLERIRQIRSGQ